MNTGYVVADVMTTKPITCTKDITLSECAKLMKDYQVGSVLIKEKGELLGIVTDKDFVYKAVAKGLDFEQPISTIMSTKIISITPGTDIFDAVKTFHKNGISHLPVMEDGELKGFITQNTILKIEPQLFELLSEKIELRGIAPGSQLIDSFDAELSGQCESCGNYSTKLTENEGRMVCPNCMFN